MDELRAQGIRILTNKYVIAILLFVVYLLFFDRYNIPSQFRRYGELREIERYREFYESEIEANEAALRELSSGVEARERYARETYFMKKDDEDVFIIVEKE